MSTVTVGWHSATIATSLAADRATAAPVDAVLIGQLQSGAQDGDQVRRNSPVRDEVLANQASSEVREFGRLPR